MTCWVQLALLVTQVISVLDAVKWVAAPLSTAAVLLLKDDLPQRQMKVLPS